MKINSLIVAAWSMFAACCAMPQVAGSGQPSFWAAATVMQSGLDCSPNRMTMAGSVKIRLPAGHGTDFGVFDPSGQFLFIAFRQNDPSSAVQPVIPASVFAPLREISLKAKEARGVLVSEKAASKPQLVFGKPGRYKIVVAPTLETDDPDLDGWCFVDVVE